MRPTKPTHGLKSFSWTSCGLNLSFGLTILKERQENALQHIQDLSEKSIKKLDEEISAE